MECAEEGCERPAGKARGLCNAHYEQRRRAGAMRRATESERFWSKVNKTDGCWIWTASLDRYGYGQFGLAGTSTKAHRWAYIESHGPIPDDLPLDHLCRVRHCVNPDHLEPVTVAENNARGVGPELARNVDTCRKGLHPWPESAVRSSTDGYLRCGECRSAYFKERRNRHA